MSLTKIGSIGINTGIQFAGITTVSTLKVGSGVTLSSDGDIFATGVTTATSFVGDGSQLTGVASTENIRTNTNATFLQNINVSGSTTTGSLVSSGAISGTTGTFTGNVAVSGANITLQDSGSTSDDRMVLGAGSDLQLYHDGNNSYLKAISGGTGDLYIFADGKTIYLRPKSGEDGVKIINDGAVELYYNNTKRFETLNGGTKVYGNLTFADDLNTIRLNDNYKILLGTSQDLKLYHDGSNSLVNADGTGNLIIQGANDIILRPADGEVGIDINANGAVDLYYDNSKKFETSSTGNQGTGVLKLISGNGSTSSDDNILHIVSGGTATRGIKLGTGRATGSAQNDGMGYIDAIDSESSGYGAQIQLRVNAARVINVGYQANKYVGINEDDPGYELVVAAQDTNESTLQILAGGNGKESNILFGAPDDADVGKISYDHNGDHMKFITGTTERFRVNSNGICLGGTGSANGLDDYEEGTWTPSFSGDINFSTKYNFTYTKIGRIVHITGYLHQRSGSFSATWQITNLPFAGSGNYNMAPLWSHGVDLAFMAYIADSSTNLNIRDRDGATAQPNELSIQMTYITST